MLRGRERTILAHLGMNANMATCRLFVAPKVHSDFGRILAKIWTECCPFHCLFELSLALPDALEVRMAILRPVMAIADNFGRPRTHLEPFFDSKIGDFPIPQCVENPKIIPRTSKLHSSVGCCLKTNGTPPYGDVPFVFRQQPMEEFNLEVLGRLFGFSTS